MPHNGIAFWFFSRSLLLLLLLFLLGSPQQTRHLVFSSWRNENAEMWQEDFFGADCGLIRVSFTVMFDDQAVIATRTELVLSVLPRFGTRRNNKTTAAT